jgi:uncharacterized beta-barrel protein YwiB (DUF1934 family)
MTKNVLITISGIRVTGEENEDIEMMIRGEYYLKNGKHYILYEEAVEGFSDTIKNVIKISPTGMDIMKKGAATTHMQFEKDKKILSCYSTPMGDLMVGVEAKNIRLDEQPDSLSVEVDYALDINYEHLSDCSIRVDVQSV